MSQYNKLSDFQYTRFDIFALQFGLFWSGGMPTVQLVGWKPVMIISFHG